MLVVISDLHFEEEKSNYIISSDGEKKIGFSRNLPEKAFRKFVVRLAEEAKENDADHLELVFAGDIFDLHRTGLWFTENPDNVRPYVSNTAVTPQQELMLLRVLDGIINDEKVAKSLKVFQLLGTGHYCVCTTKEYAQADQCVCDKPGFPVGVTIHYIPGNHDRLVNATPMLRAKVRQALGMPNSDEKFENILESPQHHTLVRHGHEYDQYNFSVDNSVVDYIPLQIPVEVYDEPPFGDFVTVDIASRIPHLFRQQYTDEKILENWQLETIYLRLLEFDDLRPQTALFNYLISMPDPDITQEEIWNIIEPVLKTLLEAVSRDPYFNKWLKKFNKLWKLDIIDIIRIVMLLRPWNWLGVPLGFVRWISDRAVKLMNTRPGVQVHAAREEAIRDGKFSFVVAGHTHHPATELIANDNNIERYYIDTGTWRSRVPASPDYKAFGRLKALTYVVIYTSGEDKGSGESRVNNKFASIDFWSGVTQRWERPSNID